MYLQHLLTVDWRKQEQKDSNNLVELHLSTSHSIPP